MTLPRCAVCGLPDAAIRRRNWTLDTYRVANVDGAPVGEIMLCTDCRHRAVRRSIGGSVTPPAPRLGFGSG